MKALPHARHPERPFGIIESAFGDPPLGGRFEERQSPAPGAGGLGGIHPNGPGSRHGARLAFWGGEPDPAAALRRCLGGSDPLQDRAFHPQRPRLCSGDHDWAGDKWGHLWPCLRLCAHRLDASLLGREALSSWRFRKRDASLRMAG